VRRIALPTPRPRSPSFPIRLTVNTQRLGSIRKFQQACRLCQGDLIALADQDDIWLPAKLREAQEAFRRHPGLGGFFSDSDLVDPDGRWQGGSFWEKIGFGAGRASRRW
jgi:hypothetical protein